MIEWFKSFFAWSAWSDPIYNDGDLLQVKFNTVTWEVIISGLESYERLSESVINEIKQYKHNLQKEIKK